MNEPRKELPPMPARIKALPVDVRGYPVPWFVAWIDGVPEFRVMDGPKLPFAVKHRVCWICGQPLDGYMSFVVGPMCAVNRISSEPPSHRDCAIFAAQACPFLTRPHMTRREKNMPENTTESAGIAIMRNPGVALVWTTRAYNVTRASGGVLFQMGMPVGTEWYAEGRRATRAEVLASIESGLPTLRELVTTEHEQCALDRQIALAMFTVPPV